jgi:hypothetical protein
MLGLEVIYKENMIPPSPPFKGGKIIKVPLIPPFKGGKIIKVPLNKGDLGGSNWVKLSERLLYK